MKFRGMQPPLVDVFLEVLQARDLASPPHNSGQAVPHPLTAKPQRVLGITATDGTHDYQLVEYCFLPNLR